MKTQIQLLFLVATVIPETLLDAILTPLYPFIIKHMIPGIPEQEVGNYLGLIRVFYNAPMLFTNLLWGRLSDIYPRKPILLLGIIACFFSTLGIGFASQYWQLAFCRFFAGIFGSNSTIAKAMIGDLTQDLPTRSWGYAIYGSVFGITGIIGPIIGGIFAPKSACSDGIFCDYPFLVILLFGAVIVLLALLLGSFLPSALPNLYIPIVEAVEVGEDVETVRNEIAREELLEQSNSGESANSNVDYNPLTSILDVNTFSILLLYCIIAFVNTNYKVGMPLYFAADEINGGLGYDASYISGSFAFLASAKLASQLLLFTPLVKLFKSPLKVYRLGMASYIPLHLVFPFMVFLSSSRTAAVIATMISFGVCESISYLSVILLITESQKQHLGLVHGISTTMTALVYILSPAIAGALWKFGVVHNISWIVFIFGSSLSLLAVVLSYFIKY
ncbi:hypothetical protein HDV06_001748 [Boothiomyces sp. JEL0866]|nr:hypothetical protein HDV06_001748 [Boothiomyces sp. JEL0866]